jgi:hypothetical protein
MKSTEEVAITSRSPDFAVAIQAPGGRQLLVHDGPRKGWPFQVHVQSEEAP